MTIGFLPRAERTGTHNGPFQIVRDAMPPLTPATIAAPLARYAHGTLLPRGARILRTSGQLGLRSDGTVPEGVCEQATVCFANIRAILAE